MERTDSTAAFASIAAYDDKSDDEEIENKGSVDNISDDEDGEDSRPPSRPVQELEDENSKSEVSTPNETKQKPKLQKKLTRLVSNYGVDDEEEEGEDDMSISSGEEEEEEETEPAAEKRGDRSTSLNAEQASSLSRSVLNKSFDEIEVPPPPAGKCSAKLQDKIAGLFDKMRREGLDMNAKIQRRKDFRNPSIYEKLIEFIGIDEKGSNYPPEVYDPHGWDNDSFYDNLDKAQKTEMEKREKERKDRTKIEFMTGTKRPPSATDATSSDDKKRKTKWDNQPTSNVTGSRGGLPGVINPSVVTNSASGTKSTVIPAVGNITKKPK